MMTDKRLIKNSLKFDELRKSESETTWRSLAEYPYYCFGSNGTVFSLWIGRLLKQEKAKANSKYYYRVALKNIDGNYKRLKVHRVVAKAFWGIDINKYDVHHLNRNSLDNRLENLYPCTRKKHNRIHSWFKIQDIIDEAIATGNYYIPVGAEMKLKREVESK